MFAATTCVFLAFVAPSQADGGELHPISATVKQTLTENGGNTARPFTLIVNIKSDSPQGIVKEYRGAAAKTKTEEGNIRYDLHRSAADKTEFVLVEQWKSLDALDSHLHQDYTIQFVEYLQANATIELTVLRPVPAKAPKKRAEAE